MGNALKVLQEYMGTGGALILFLFAVIYLYLREKRKPRRILFVYVPILLLVLILNPLFFRLLREMDVVYFRLFWLLPVIVEIAYCAVVICETQKGRAYAALAVVFVTLTAALGRPVYQNPLYSPAENIYHVPDSVVHICDAIQVPGREVMALFPEELLLYVRQYSPVVCMPYGREVLTGVYDALHETACAEKVDMEQLVPLSREKSCHYLIFPQKQRFSREPSDYGWEVFLETDGYTVYRDTGVELAVPEE